MPRSEEDEFEALLDGLEGEARDGVRQILRLSEEQVAQLPPEQRAQVEQIRDMRRQHADFVKQERHTRAARAKATAAGADDEASGKAASQKKKMNSDDRDEVTITLCFGARTHVHVCAVVSKVTSCAVSSVS